MASLAGGAKYPLVDDTMASHAGVVRRVVFGCDEIKTFNDFSPGVQNSVFLTEFCMQWICA